jgi:hypothetical protein
MFREDPGRPIEIPEGFDQKPAGAAVSDDGMVACVTCRTRVPLAQADIVGQGYRCARCSQQASVNALAGRSDVGAHLDRAQREGLHRSGVQLLLGGLAMIAGGIIIVVIIPAAIKAIGLSVGGLAVASLGVTRMRAAR